LKNDTNPDAEVELLLEALYHHYGYDFRRYSKAHILRRLSNRMGLSRLNSYSELRKMVLGDRAFAAQVLQDLSITVTEMFRDPGFFLSLRKKVIPLLKTYSFIKVWNAGCSTGEEAYSMAILLKEEGLYDKATIYATDYNQVALDQARAGIYSTENIKEYTSNYQKSGGKNSFSEYYMASYQRVIMDHHLKKNIVWANHNLVTDNVFAEVHLILCRNVLIYFQKDLQEHVYRLFYESLVNGGILCLGSRESLRLSGYHEKFTTVDAENRIYKKKYEAKS